MFKTLEELQAQALSCNDNKGASYTKNDKRNTQVVYDSMVNAMTVLQVSKVETRKDFSLGQLGEGLHNCAFNKAHTARYAKAYGKDFEDNIGEIEVKVSVNCKDLCTPLTKAVRVHLLTPKGWVAITKKTLVEIFASPEDFKDYVKETPTGLRLKLNAYELGTPIALLNKVFGY